MMSRSRFVSRLLIFSIISTTFFTVKSIRLIPDSFDDTSSDFMEAPAYQNGIECSKTRFSLACDPSAVHIAMTLDPSYLRGTVSAIHSILKHTSCPKNIFFHFIASGSSTHASLVKTLSSVFPSLSFKVYTFDETKVKNLISSSIRQALDTPLNYARSYLSEILSSCVTRVIYLDSDLIVVDDIQKLWKISSLSGSRRTISAPEYCHTNFTKYFTDQFWSDQKLSSVFDSKTPCYFNTGVMVIDLEKWREGDYTRKIEKWMKIQKEDKRIYELGSLPPFLLVFGGEIEGIDHKWNQHGLGGDNVVSSCRSLHPGPVSLMHWSGKGKPWVRLDDGKPCPIDYLWAPYDLYKSQRQQYRQYDQDLEIL